MRQQFTLIIFAVLLSVAGFAQENTVTLKTTGSAETKEKAVQYALRSAIEQAFGAFISSNTEILNDELVADEITSVASGNIEKYEILSETVNEEGASWFVTANVVVSVGKLTEFVQAKGVEVEVKGGLFAINIKQKQLNSDGEYKAILDMLKPFHEAMLNAYDYELEVGQPVAKDQENKNWKVTLKVLANANKNLESAMKIIKATLSSLSLTTEELTEYKKLNKEAFPVFIGLVGQETYIGNRLSKDSYPKGTVLSSIADEFGVPVNIVEKKVNEINPDFLKGSGANAKLKTDLPKAYFFWSKEADPIYYLRNRKSYEALQFLIETYLSELYGHNFNVNSSIHNYYSFPDVSVSLDKALIKSQGHAFKFEGEQSTLTSIKEVNPYQDHNERDVTDRDHDRKIRYYQIYSNVENYISMIILGGCIPEEELPEFKSFVQNHFEKKGFNTGNYAAAYAKTKGRYDANCVPNEGKNQVSLSEVSLLFKPQKAFEFKDELTLSEVEELNGYKVSLNKNVFSFSNGGITIKNGDYRIVIPVHPVLSEAQVEGVFGHQEYRENTNDQIYSNWNSLCINGVLTDWQIPSSSEVMQIATQYPFPFYRKGKTAYAIDYYKWRSFNTSNTFGDVFDVNSIYNFRNFTFTPEVSATNFEYYKNRPMAFSVKTIGIPSGGTSICIRRIK